MTKKGIAVISGSGDLASDLKHTMTADGDANLGTADAVSTMSGTIGVLGVDGNDLVATLESKSGSIRQRTVDSAATHSPLETNLENTRIATAADAATGATPSLRGHDYVARTDTNYADNATSLKDADLKLDTQLSNSNTDIIRIQGAKTVSGSLAYQVSQRLEGTGVEDTWKTLEALQTAMDSDPDLRGTLTSKINTMKSEIRGAAPADDTIAAQQAVLIAHNTTAEDTHEAGLTAKISNVTASIGASSTFEITYGVATYCLTGLTSLHAADDMLDQKLQSRQNRLDAMLGAVDKAVDGVTKTAGMRSDTLSIAAGQNAEMSGDTTSTKFIVPLYDAVPAHLKDGSALKADMSDHEGEVFYLTTADDSDPVLAPFSVAEKFYFCEGGQWFMSPFYAISEASPDYGAIVFNGDDWTSEWQIALNATGLIGGLNNWESPLLMSDHGVITPQEGTQTLSLLDTFGDGGITSVDFKNPDTDTIVFSIVPGYTTGPYDIQIVWDGSTLSVNGTAILTYSNGSWANAVMPDTDNDGTPDWLEPAGDYDLDGTDAANDPDVQTSVTSGALLPAVILFGASDDLVADATTIASEAITITSIEWLANGTTIGGQTTNTLPGATVAAMAADDQLSVIIRYTVDSSGLSGAHSEIRSIVVPDFTYVYSLSVDQYGGTPYGDPEGTFEVIINGNMAVNYGLGELATGNPSLQGTLPISEGDTHILNMGDIFNDGGQTLTFFDNYGNPLYLGLNSNPQEPQEYLQDTYSVEIDSGTGNLVIKRAISSAGVGDVFGGVDGIIVYDDNPDATYFYVDLEMMSPPMVDQTVNTFAAEIADNSGITAIDVMWQSNDPADNTSGTGFGNPTTPWTDIGSPTTSTIDVNDPISVGPEDPITITASLVGKILRAQYTVTDGAGDQNVFYVPSDEFIAETDGGHAIIEELSDVPTTFMDPTGQWVSAGVFEYNSGQGVYSSEIRAMDANLMDAANPFSISSQGSHGTAVITAQDPSSSDIRYGEWIYTPATAGAFTGADTFTIKVVDADGNETLQVITINLMSPDADADNVLDPVDDFHLDPGEQTAVQLTAGGDGYFDGPALRWTFFFDTYHNESMISFIQDGTTTVMIQGGFYMDENMATQPGAPNTSTTSTPPISAGLTDISLDWADSWGDNGGMLLIHRDDQVPNPVDPASYLTNIGPGGYPAPFVPTTFVLNYDGKDLVVDGGTPISVYPGATLVPGSGAPATYTLEGENMVNAVSTLENLRDNSFLAVTSPTWEETLTAAHYDVGADGNLTAAAQTLSPIRKLLLHRRSKNPKTLLQFVLI